MSAKIIPFARTVSPTAATIPAIAVPPPLLTSLNPWIDGTPWLCNFLGTRESLIAWGIATDEEFPVGRRRQKLNGRGRPSVRRNGFMRDELFDVRFHFNPGCDPKAVAEIHRLASNVRAHFSSCENEAAKRLSMLKDLRLSLFVRGDYFDSAQIGAYDALVDDLIRVVAAVLFDTRAKAKPAQVQS